MNYILNRLEQIYEGGKFNDDECRNLIDTATQIFRISKMARCEGLLSILSIMKDPDFVEYVDEYCNKYNLFVLDESSFEMYLCSLLEEVTMGVDRADIQKMGLLIMSTSNFDRVEFVKYAIWLEGALSIQSGVHPRVLIKLLAAYLPVGARIRFMEEIDNEW